MLLAIKHQLKVGTLLFLDPLEVLDLLPQIGCFAQIRQFKIFLESWIIVLQFMELKSCAVFDDQSGCGVDVEIDIFTVVQTNLMTYHRDLAVMKVESHDRIGHWAGVDGAILEVSHEEHGEEALE